MSAVLNLASFIADLAAMVGLILFPAALVADWRRHHKINRPNRIVAIAGLLLAVHLGYLACCFRRLLTPSTGFVTIDVDPLDTVLVFTVNWIIPLCAFSILFAVAAVRLKHNLKSAFVALAAFAITTAAFASYTRWLDGTFFAG